MNVWLTVNDCSNFSPEKKLEYVETGKTRVVLLELEKDWWLVAVSLGDLHPHTRDTLTKANLVYRPNTAAG